MFLKLMAKLKANKKHIWPNQEELETISNKSLYESRDLFFGNTCIFELDRIILFKTQNTCCGFH